MKIGVVVVNWNGGKYLFDSVTSILEQQYKPHRVVVVDNASTDGSIRAVDHLVPRIEIRRMEANLGFARANNDAVASLDDCDWVALLNPDAVADSDWLAQLSEGVDKYPQAHSFATRMMSLDDPAVIDGAGDCYHISGFARRRFHGCRLQMVEAEIDQPVFGPCGGAAFYRRSSFLACGGFDESYFCYCEDIDLAFRLQLAGFQSWFLHRAVVWHKGGGTQTDGGRFADYYGHRNIVWTWFKNMPMALLIPLLPVHLLANLAVCLQKTVARGDLVVVLAKRDAFAHLPVVLKTRRKAQGSRRLPLGRLWKLMSKGIAK